MMNVRNLTDEQKDKIKKVAMIIGGGVLILLSGFGIVKIVQSKSTDVGSGIVKIVQSKSTDVGSVSKELAKVIDEDIFTSLAPSIEEAVLDDNIHTTIFDRLYEINDGIAKLVTVSIETVYGKES